MEHLHGLFREDCRILLSADRRWIHRRRYLRIVLFQLGEDLVDLLTHEI
jgi:hypothetical protein